MSEDRFITLTDITYDRDILEKFYESVKHFAQDYAKIRDNATEGLFSSIRVDDLEGKEYLDYPEISDIVKLFNPEVKQIKSGNIAITVYKPGFQFHPHVDFSRKSVIMIPILPSDGGAGVDYYDYAILGDKPVITGHSCGVDSHQEEFYLGTHTYSTVHPTLMDATQVHGVRNDSGEARVYLQLSLYDEFERCKELIKSGDFYNKDK